MVHSCKRGTIVFRLQWTASGECGAVGFRARLHVATAFPSGYVVATAPPLLTTAPIVQGQPRTLPRVSSKTVLVGYFGLSSIYILMAAILRFSIRIRIRIRIRVRKIFMRTSYFTHQYPSNVSFC